MTNKYLSVKEAVEFTKRSKSTIRNWVAQGRVKSRKDGRRVKYLASDLASMITAVKLGPKIMPKGDQSSDLSKPDNSKFDPPPWMSEEGAAVFTELMEQVESYDIIKQADVHGLAMCAKYLAEFRDIERRMEDMRKADPETGGMITIDKNKSSRIHPLARHQKFCAEKFFEFSARYGLTPADREALKIVVREAEGKDEREPVR